MLIRNMEKKIKCSYNCRQTVYKVLKIDYDVKNVAIIYIIRV